MSNLINRQDAIDELDKGAWGVEWDKALAKTMIESLPSAEREGTWVSKPGIYGVVYCSRCDYELHMNDTNYCPKCGARMVNEMY